MRNIIDETLSQALMRGKRLEVIARYIRMKYRVNIDAATLRRRVEMAQSGPMNLQKAS